MYYKENRAPVKQPGCGCAEGISAPYCPPPMCPPPRPATPMDGCREEKPPCPPMQKAVRWPRPVKPCPPPHMAGAACVPPAWKHPENDSRKGDCVLLQKIICCETRHIPQLCVSLQPEGLPPCTHGPYRLVSLQQSGAQPWWSRLPEQGRDGRSHIQVSIPVCCEICDGDGCTHAAGAVVEVQVSYRCGSRESDGWRTSLFVVPCLRLVGGDICSQEPCFTVMLQVHLELYLLRPEPCAMHRPEPPCPPLPLYPAPPRHPCSCHERR